METLPIQPSSDGGGPVDPWMRRALDLAAGVRGLVWPNPPVGCVIHRDGVVLAEAATHPGGRPHAERQAIDRAGRAARGATMHVTLEPCCHWGRTPPCADAIIEAGIARVVCAIRDPDPRVDGGGFARLLDAGVKLEVGQGAAEARRIMSGFFHRVRLGVPELLVLAAPAAEVPAGVDALLRIVGDGVHVVARDGRPTPKLHRGKGLLRDLGGLGLTSVAIWQGDLQAAGLQDADDGMVMSPDTFGSGLLDRKFGINA